MMNGRVASPFNFNADILVAYDCESTYEYNVSLIYLFFY
jgi:hypothetical protein